MPNSFPGFAPLNTTVDGSLSGVVLPPGGSTGQALIKDSNQDYDASWHDVSDGGTGTSDHGQLTGLSDDDHTQYLTNARGDARYSPISHTHSFPHTYNASDYASVKAAYDAAVINHPTGDFTVHVSGEVAHGGSFTWSVRGALTGDSTSSSKVNCSSGDTITITSQYFACHNIEFKFATQATAGTVFKNVGGFYSDIHDVTITNPNIGFEYSGASPIFSGRHVRSNIIMTNVRLYGDTFDGTHDVLTTNLYCLGSTENYPMYIAGSVGLKTAGWVEGCQFTNCTYLLFERPHDINGSNHNTITNCYFDSGKYAAALYNSNNNTLDNCWYSNGRGQAGVSGQGLVVYDSNNITIAGSRMVNCGSSGLSALNCDNLSLIGNMIANNSWDSANAYYGATVHDCNNIAVIGNQMSNTVIPGGATQINSLIFSGTNTGTALGNPSTSLINTTGINTGGDALTAGNNNFTGANVFNGTVEFNSGMIDLNNSQGVSGQIWKSSGADVAPQWTSLSALLKTVGGASLPGTGDITTFTSPMVFNSTVDLNSGIIDLNNTQGVSGQIFKSSGSGVPPQWTSIADMLKACNGTEIAGTGDFVKHANGTGSIPSGSSTYTTTITHGLGFTPTAGEINITPTSAYGFAWQVGTINSSTFTVVYSNNTQALNFGWSVTRFNP